MEKGIQKMKEIVPQKTPPGFKEIARVELPDGSLKQEFLPLNRLPRKSIFRKGTINFNEKKNI